MCESIDPYLCTTYVERMIFPNSILQNSRNGNQINCNAMIKWLINGRIQVIITTGERIKTFQSYKLSSIKNEYELTADILAFSNKIINPLGLNEEKYSGFTSLVSIRKTNKDAGLFSCKYLLTNSHWNLKSFEITIKDIVFHFRLITASDKMSQKEINNIRDCYKINIISNEIVVENIEKDQIPEVDEIVKNLIFLMSIANRGYVFLSGKFVYNSSGELFSCEYKEPIFHNTSWGRQLIPPENLKEFLLTTYQSIREVDEYKLHIALDHYIQSLSLRSGWSTALGIFTALETIINAFYSTNKNTIKDTNYYWVVPDKNFRKDKALYEELLDLLQNHFTRFSTLSESERNSLCSTFRGLNRRSYKSQMINFLESNQIKYEKQELQSIIDIRNEIVHQGIPQEESNDIAWDTVENAATLFERIVLRILGFDGIFQSFT